ncbi:hypothetical protein LY78DRAFT_483547 [Colletotrichum sublineola]|nr:hypothetical protein LY78DRAFT_483547 [Colletotrichum sublineola]
MGLPAPFWARLPCKSCHCARRLPPSRLTLVLPNHNLQRRIQFRTYSRRSLTGPGLISPLLPNLYSRAIDAPHQERTRRRGAWALDEGGLSICDVEYASFFFFFFACVYLIALPTFDQIDTSLFYMSRLFLSDQAYRLVHVISNF